MADVPLSEYVDQVRELVRAHEFAAALELGRHILQYYPRHLETYTLLAQACIETNDLAGAADLFRRVLGADPENLAALTGMALLSEAQEKYQDALWYLERAFEIQPANDELRRELVRLREIYYGSAPERLELTPGALARSYARQGQYAQAIGEFRRLLRTESQRFDAKVALAEVLYRAGRTEESAQVAQQVIADAPFALKPNLILGALWTENAVPEGQQFLLRAYALDPEERVVRDLIGTRFVSEHPPRVPAFNQAEAAEPVAHLTTALAEAQAEQAAEFEPEIESAGQVEPLTAAEESAWEELGAMALAAAAMSQAGAAKPAEAASLTAVPESAQLAPAPPAAEPVAPISAEPVEPEKASSAEPAPAARAAHKPVPTDAIAAAAAALATSIARDKTNQPAPARRGHPSLPKVRPVIRSAQEQLPAWLRIAAPPSAAQAAFDVPPPTDADRIVPLAAEAAAKTSGAGDDRPEWLVQAEAANTQAPSPLEPEEQLPEWLRPLHEQQQSQESSAPTPPPAEPELPDWLRDAQSQAARASDLPEAAQRESETARASVTAEPDWFNEIIQAQSTAPPQDDAATAEGWTSAPASTDRATDRPAWLDAIEQEPPKTRADAFSTANEETLAPRQAETAATNSTAQSAESAAPRANAPDSAALLALAREKRARDDLKGALELYERVMLRRPNYLDEVIGDLNEITQSESAPMSAHRLLGEAYAMAGRFRESLEQYRIAMGK